MQNNSDTNKNIIVGPDYSQLIKHQTNSAIVEAFITFLFSKDTKFNVKTILLLVRNMIILVIIKIILGESATFIDKFKFTNLNVFKYAYQWLKFSEKKYQIVKIGNKWVYENKNISINTLTPFLETKLIYLNQPGTYYYGYLSYLLKVIVDNNSIIFAIPNIDSVIRYIELEVIRKNEEIIFGGKTMMSKINISPTGVIKIEPMQLVHAFPTENYLKLEESLKSYFLIDSILKSYTVPLCVSFDGEAGTGKCLHPDTPVLMYNGSIKLAKNIVIGDQLMGDDSTPRNVLSTCTGEENMYRVKQLYGDDYIVNESHILSLVSKSQSVVGLGYKKQEIIDISVKDYLQRSNSFKKNYRGYKVGVEFESKDVPIDPYLFGVWLNDGTFAESSITNTGNIFLNFLKEYNLINNKHIPDIYKCNNREIRLKLLAGLIDSDGYYDSRCNYYEITQKNDKLANDILYLCRSLGFKTNLNKREKTCTNSANGRVTNTYNIIGISGFGLNQIPVLLDRKKANPRKQKKNALVYGINVELLGPGKYRGFEIDGNKRFLLGDFTVTHNTTFGSYIASAGIFNRIIVYNLMQGTNVNFLESMNNLERQLYNSTPKDKKTDDEQESVLLILDEIDKWLESYIDQKIHSLREDARTKKEVGKTDGASIVYKANKLTEIEEKEKKQQLHNEFLDQLYKLVDGLILADSRKYVIIFNTNNFDGLFQNTDKRYIALRDRFQQYKFIKNGKKEIIMYINNIICRMKHFITDNTIPENNKKMYAHTVKQLTIYDEDILRHIPDKISISYRTLIKILRKNCFNIPNTIKDLCEMESIT